MEADENLMAITGRVPLLALLGLVAVVLRPSHGLAVAAGRDCPGRPGRCWRPADPRGTSYDARPGGAHRGAAAETLLVVENVGRRRSTACSATPGSPAPAPPPTDTASAGSRRPRLLTTALLPAPPRRPAGVGSRSALLGPLGLGARQRTTSVPGSVRVAAPLRVAQAPPLSAGAAARPRRPGRGAGARAGHRVRLAARIRARRRRPLHRLAGLVAAVDVVVRTWQPERDRRVVLVLDTSRTSAGRVDDVPRLDSAMDAALLLAALATRAGDRIDFVAGDRRIRARLARQRSATSPRTCRTRWPSSNR